MGDFLASSRDELSGIGIGIGSSRSSTGPIAYRQQDDNQSRNLHSHEQTSNNNTNNYNSGYPGSSSSSNTYPDHQPLNNNEQKQSQASDYDTFAQPRAPASASSAGLANPTPRRSSSSSSSAGNVVQQQQQQPPLRQDYNPQDYNYHSYKTHYDYSQPTITPGRKYSNSNMSMDTSTPAGNVAATSQSQQHVPFPHQSPHPNQDSSYSHDTTQAQATGSSTTTTTTRQSSPPYGYQPQRTVSDNFDTTAKAGPPSPGGKMDLLPFSHDTTPAGAKENNASGTASGSASSRHRSRGHHHSNSTSSTHASKDSHHSSNPAPHHPQSTRPTNASNAFASKPPTSNVEVIYHEPVAPSSGRSANSKGSSTTSEFTKRKNWSQRIVEEMQDILHVLSPHGLILFISPSITDLIGFTPEEMVGRKIVDFMDKSDIDHFENEFKTAIMNETSLITYYRFIKKKKHQSGGGGANAADGNASHQAMRTWKEEDSDDDSNRDDDASRASSHNNNADTTLSASMANLSTRDDILVEITGQPYYTISTDGDAVKSGNSRKTGNSRRRSRGHAMDEEAEDDVNMERLGGLGGNDVGMDGDVSSSSASGGSGSRPQAFNNAKKAGGISKTCKCFFAMARPYPSRNNATLDTFLELKIENEKLRNKLADIYREIEGDYDNGNSVSPTTANPLASGEYDNSASAAIAGGDGATGTTNLNLRSMGRTHASDGSGFQLSQLGQNRNQPYYGTDPLAMAVDPPYSATSTASTSNHDRQISGMPSSRMSGVFAQQYQQQSQQQQQQSESGSMHSRTQTQNSGGRDGAGYNNSYVGARQGVDGSLDPAIENGTIAPAALRGGPIDQGDGLISSAGLIPSSSNTYGALGIGISASSRHGNHASSSTGGAGQGDDYANGASHAGAGAAGQASHASAGAGGAFSTTTGTAAANAAAAAAAAAEDKKKKIKKQRTDEGEFVCRDCGTVDSPEWRRGPLGPKTLCNACGLRWAKKNKQQQRNSIGNADGVAAK